MRGSLVAALVMLWPVCGAAQTFYKDEMSGCSVGTFQTDQGLSVRWTGPCVDGKAQGRGIAQWSIAGQPAGYSEGTYRAGLLDGRAIVVHKLGARAEGDYANGKLNGRCILVQRDGARFDGQCADDRKNGFGKVSLADGGHYEGEFRDDQATGHGVFLWRDGRVYDGEFVDYKMTGQGTMAWPDGEWFHGGWADGKYEGEGVRVFRDGAYYQGRYEHNLPDGPGEFVGLSITGKQGVWSGIWHQGCLVTADGRTSDLRADEPTRCGFN